MKKAIINKTFNIWDPYGVFGLGPKDEYSDFSVKTIEIIENSLEIDCVNNLFNYLKQIDSSLKMSSDEKIYEIVDLIIMIYKRF